MEAHADDRRAVRTEYTRGRDEPANQSPPRPSNPLMAGQICLWRYRENARSYPGFHLSADPAGCAQLITLLQGLSKARAPQIGHVVLDPVTASVLAVPNNAGATISAYQHWELLVDPRFSPEQLQFSVVGNRARTEVSKVQLEALAAGIEDIRQGRGDYSIGDDDHQLWFWWQRS